MTFPASPINGATTTVNGILYIYDSTKNSWKRSPASISDIQANLGTATTNITTLFSNAATQATSINTTNANIGAYQVWANVTFSVSTYSNTNVEAYIGGNVGSYQTYANANAATQTTSINSIDANIGSYQTYANTKIGTNTNGNLVVVATTPSTDATTGALVVRGGVGIAGNIYSNAVYTTTGVYWANNNAPFSSAPGGTTGMLQYNSSSTFAGAANVSYDSTSGNLLITTPTNGTATGGALTVQGGASFVGNIFVTGNILATNQIIAAYSDERLKNKLGAILNPIHKVKQIETFYYTPNDLALSIGVNDTRIQVGVSAQSVEKVLPEVVTSSPINSEYKTVSYERIVPLLIAAIIEQQSQIDQLKETVNVLQNR